MIYIYIIIIYINYICRSDDIDFKIGRVAVRKGALQIAKPPFSSAMYHGAQLQNHDCSKNHCLSLDRIASHTIACRHHEVICQD